MAVPQSRFGDVILALFVVAITALLLIPLPTVVLDILISLNLCISLLVLLVGLYTPNALALLSFPSLLLLTTLFRLSLNVASARLILSQADAGRVIETFGTFLIRGEIVVGIIIFLIITIVNYIVISRGAGRVSEVAARFALDALPGKQMAIDADLRAGTISRSEAEKRRDELRQESQLYGSMDGAMKFVQGDAIAGLFIIVTNIVGGLYIGISSGRSFAEAIETYTVLTVGDGLVSQIPALLISICAGIIVTRVSSGEGATLGADVGSQLFRSPTTVIFSGLVLFLVGLVPGLPHLSFLTIGAVFIFVGWMMRRGPLKLTSSGALEIEYKPGLLELPDNSVGMGSEDAKLEIILDSQVLFKSFAADSKKFFAWWEELQDDFYEESGLRLPGLKVSAERSLAPCSFITRANAVRCDSGKVPLDGILIETNPASADLMGLEVLLEEHHPFTGHLIFWSKKSRAVSQLLEAAEIRGFDFMQYIALRCAEFLLRHPEEIFGISETFALLKEVETRSPGFMVEALGAHFLPVPLLVQALQALIREGINIRDFRQIIESIASYCAEKNITRENHEALSIEQLVSHVCVDRKRQLISRRISERQTLKVCTFAQALEDIFDEVEISGDGGSITMAPAVFERLRAQMREVVEPLQKRGTEPFSLLCKSSQRMKIRSFLENCGYRLGLISFDELDARLPIESVGIIREGNPLS